MKKLHIIIVFVFSLGIYFLSIYSNDQIAENGWENFLLRVLSDCLVFLILSAIVSLLIAIVPFKRLDYLSKYKKIIIPVFLMVLMTASTIFYLNETYSYDQVSIPDNIDCRLLQTGYFSSPQLLIERTPIYQIQTNQSSGESITYEILWKSDCEYELIDIDSKKRIYKAKIFEVNSDSHKLYFAEFESNIAHVIEVKNGTEK